MYPTRIPHGDATSDVYSVFLHFIMAGIGFELTQNLIMGCDDEKAIRKAVRDILPQATNILCTRRHFKENFDNNLKNKEGVKQSHRLYTLDRVFGPVGLANAPDAIVFESIENEVQKH